MKDILFLLKKLISLLRVQMTIKIQSIDSIETYVCGTKKDLICKKEETKWYNITKQYKKRLTLTILQKKTKKII